jgi:hypothetical protein
MIIPTHFKIIHYIEELKMKKGVNQNEILKQFSYHNNHQYFKYILKNLIDSKIEFISEDLIDEPYQNKQSQKIDDIETTENFKFCYLQIFKKLK